MRPFSMPEVLRKLGRKSLGCSTLQPPRRSRMCSTTSAHGRSEVWGVGGFRKTARKRTSMVQISAIWRLPAQIWALLCFCVLLMRGGEQARTDSDENPLWPPTSSANSTARDVAAQTRRRPTNGKLQHTARAYSSAGGRKTRGATRRLRDNAVPV